jgi:hypothetical protein
MAQRNASIGFRIRRESNSTPDVRNSLGAPQKLCRGIPGQISSPIDGVTRIAVRVAGWF